MMTYSFRADRVAERGNGILARARHLRRGFLTLVRAFGLAPPVVSK